MQSKIPAVLLLCVLLIVIAGCGGGSGLDLNKVGSEQESVTPPDLMGILILRNSGYTRQDERDRLDRSTGVAGVSGLPTRNRGEGKNPEAVGSAQAGKPETGLLRLWAEAGR